MLHGDVRVHKPERRCVAGRGRVTFVGAVLVLEHTGFHWAQSLLSGRARANSLNTATNTGTQGDHTRGFPLLAGIELSALWGCLTQKPVRTEQRQ